MPTTIETRDYQVTAINAAVEQLKTTDRTQLHMAPGSGKTIVALKIKEALDPLLTVFFAPTIQLLHQQLTTWENISTVPYRSLSIASGSYTQIDKDKLSDTISQHLGTTTDLSTIRHFIISGGHRVIFSTYRSGPKVVEALSSTECHIDLAIFDEAHRVAGSYEKNCTVLLSDKETRIRKRLFLTATPRVLREQTDALEFAGMDNIAQFGEVAYTLNFREAVKRKILVDYQVIAAAVTEQDLQAIEITDSREEKIALAAISKAVDNYALRKGLTFHNNIPNARRFSKLLRQWFSTDTYIKTLNTSHTIKHRRQVLSAAKLSDRCLLTNVRILGEGIDFTDLDYIAFVDPKSSPIDIIQNIGRVMRPHKGKTVGTIIIPILIESTDNGRDCKINSSRFSSVFHVASAIGSLDTIFATILNGNTSHNVDGRSRIKEFISNHIKVIGIDSDDKDVIKNIEEKIRLYVVTGSKRNRQTASSEEMLKRLKIFCKTHNRLPSRVIEEELPLFNFVIRYKRNTVDAEMHALVKSIVEKYRQQKIDRKLPMEERFNIFEAWVKKHRRFPYHGHAASEKAIRELYEDYNMTITDEEIYMRQWIRYHSSNFSPELKKRLVDLKDWVAEVSPNINQLVKKHKLANSDFGLKKKLLKLGVEPHFCPPDEKPTMLWDIEKVKEALNAQNSKA